LRGASVLICFDSPVTAVLCSEGSWKNASDKISIQDNAVYLTADRCSWVRLQWEVSFGAQSLVLGDAWERTYGDTGWQPVGQPAFYPWYFSVKDADVTRCIGVKTGPSALCCWHVERNIVTLLLDVRCGCKDTLFEGRTVRLAELVSLCRSGDTFETIRLFCNMMCSNPRPFCAPFYGGDDWYTCYGNNSFQKVLDHAKILAECAEGLKNRPFQTIDAGWQLCHNWYPGEEYIGGPFRYCNDNFGSMKDMAEAISALDVRPGIWIRPMETVEHIPEDAYLRRVKNIKYLDPSHPYAREKMLEDIKTLRNWGYQLIKHDFSVVDTFGRYAFEWTESAVEGDWAFYDTHKTSAEIIRQYYAETVQAAPDVLFIGCNTLSHLSAGLFHIYRSGDDTSGLDFSRTVKMGVNTLAFRGVQHGSFYSIDADCVGITSKIPWEKNIEWLKLLQYSGTTVNVSVESACYTNAVRQALTDAFAVISTPHPVAKPLDWDKTLTPCRWETFDGVKEFEW